MCVLACMYTWVSSVVPGFLRQLDSVTGRGSRLSPCSQGLTSLAWAGEGRPLPATMWADKLLPAGGPRNPEALEDRGARGVPAQFSSVQFSHSVVSNSL